MSVVNLFLKQVSVHFFALFLFSSCSIYNQKFDCPPPSGIPCASVTDIEDMILDTEKGPDIIVQPEVNKANHCFWCGSQKNGSSYSLSPLNSSPKLWICRQKKGNDKRNGYYFNKSDSLGSEITVEIDDLFPCTTCNQIQGD